MKDELKKKIVKCEIQISRVVLNLNRGIFVASLLFGDSGNGIGIGMLVAGYFIRM